jgi:hypothetical protein
MKTLIRPLFALALLAATTANAQEAKDAPADWPLVFTSGGDQVQVFKPQPETFDGTSFTTRAAVALQRSQDTEPVFGAIWGGGELEIDRSSRMGQLSSFKVTDARFPGITDMAELDRIKNMLSTEIPAHAAPISIDWLVASLEEEQLSADSYDNNPPSILYRDKPSILLFIDGDPIYQPVKDLPGDNDPVYAKSATPVDRVVNTPFLLVRPQGGDNWLYGSGLWYTAKDINGPWTWQKKAPAELEALALQVDTTPAAKPDGTVPEIVVSTTPAVLVDVNGSPQMEPFKNTSLMYVTNTDDDLFLNIPTQEYYLLASGRWYSTKDLKNGPWRFVPSDALPADFAQVPEGSKKDGILAHVAGTDAAREAVRDASIPQTARVDRRSASLSVTYNGDPQFERIGNTGVWSAVNASTTVLRINGSYHVCDNAVWYEGNSPDGPWTVSTSVPAEVNEIPPSDPNYRVRYVYIYDSTPEVVFVGYTPGYLGSYVQYGTVVYGTGYYYRPWPHFWYPRPFTYGFNMYYNPWYGWGFGMGWGYNWFYPGWNGYGYYGYHPWGWWGPYAYCPHYEWHPNGYYYGHRSAVAGSASRASTGDLRGPAAASNLYAAQRKPGVRPTEMSRTAALTRQPARNATVNGNSRMPARGTQGNTGMKPIAGDHFTDRDGNVYRINAGRTEELQNGRWNTLPDDPARNPSGPTRTPGNTAPARPPANNGSMERDPQRGTVGTPSRSGYEPPQTITRERQRAETRERDYRGYRQQPEAPRSQPQRTAPQTRPAPETRPAPTPAPANSPRNPHRGR